MSEELNDAENLLAVLGEQVAEMADAHTESEKIRGKYSGIVERYRLHPELGPYPTELAETVITLAANQAKIAKTLSTAMGMLHVGLTEIGADRLNSAIDIGRGMTKENDS